MKKIQLIIRIGLGLILLLFGFNKFFWFLQDFDFSGYPEAEYLFNSLRFSWSKSVGKGYLMNLVGLIEIIVGLLLVAKKWVPFALIMLAPISINLVLFHAFLNIPSIGPAIIVLVLNAYLMYKNWDSFQPLFK